jgi:Peptidase S7, Flavivirus NS3 serine protease
MTPPERMLSIKQNAEGDLLKRSGVTGVDIGNKIVKGEETGELAIRVYVEKKKKVSGEQAVPSTIDGVKTDVIERKFVLHPLLVKIAELVLMSDTGTYDPLQGGISIGPCRSVYLNAKDAACHGAPGPGYYVFVGTLGAFVRDNVTKAEMMLSNFHVMCVDNGWAVGDQMAQPARPDGGTCPTKVVGTLQKASLGGSVDCAVANHTARGFKCSIVDIGNVTGTDTATVGLAVRKRGRTTGLTYGTVDTTTLTVKIDYCNGLGIVTLTNQIGIKVDPAQSAKFGDNGDSGSVVVNSVRKVVGLYFAGTSDGSYGVANPIAAVLSALNVNMCVPVQIVKKDEPDKTPDIIKKSEPDIKKFEPDIKKFEPDIKKFEPDIKKFEPDIKKFEPDVKKFEPDVKKNEPDIKKGEIEGPKLDRETTIPTSPIVSTSPGDPMEQRLARIEAALAQLVHFIQQEQRPQVENAPLR